MADLGGCALIHRQQSGTSPDLSAIRFAKKTAMADAIAPIGATAPFHRTISESAHQQVAEEHSRKKHENRREKQKQRKL
jgi:hypothetical protein